MRRTWSHELPKSRAHQLAVVAVITCLGFASVYIARQDVISGASLTYEVFFLCLYLAAHLVLRLAVPTPTRTSCRSARC